MTRYNSYIRELVIKYRKKNNINQNEFAKKCNIPRTTLIRFESEIAPISLENFEKLLKTMNMSLSKFESNLHKNL